MKTLSVLALVFTLLGAPQAFDILLIQNEQAELPVLLAYDVETWLSEHNPGNTTLYYVTTYQTNPYGEFISLAGIDPAAGENWNVEDNSVWLGTLKKSQGQLVLFYTSDPSACHNCALAARKPSAAGGGAEIYLPWQSGKKVYYGPKGIHDGTGALNGESAVDFVSGNVYGADMASDMVYASADGEITHVCDDGTSIGMLVGSGTDLIGYYHFATTANFSIGQTVTRGQALGQLKHGNFSDTCGYAVYSEPAAEKYHLHWIFYMSNNRYQAEGWVLTSSNNRWTRGNETVSPNQILIGGGGTGSTTGLGESESGTTSTGPLVIIPGEMVTGGGNRLWDYVITGVNSFYGWVKPSLPPAISGTENDTLWMATAGIVRMFLQDLNLLFVNDTLNIMPVVYLSVLIISSEITRFVLGFTMQVLYLLGAIRGSLKWW